MRQMSGVRGWSGGVRENGEYSVRTSSNEEDGYRLC